MQVPWTRPPGHPDRSQPTEGDGSDRADEAGATRTEQLETTAALANGSPDGAPEQPPRPQGVADGSTLAAAAAAVDGAAAVKASTKMSTAEEVAQEVEFRARSLFMQLSDCGALPRVPLQRTATPIVPVPAPGTRGGRWPKLVRHPSSASDKPPVVGHAVRPL